MRMKGFIVFRKANAVANLPRCSCCFGVRGLLTLAARARI